MIDVDHFKRYNDSFGHQAGDDALRVVAEALRCARPSDFIARYGGEEFAVILPATAPDGARVLAERIRQAVEQAACVHGRLTVSVGIGCLPPGSSDGALLVAAADQALYASQAVRTQPRRARRPRGGIATSFPLSRSLPESQPSRAFRRLFLRRWFESIAVCCPPWWPGRSC